jgi:hypothetical protein
MALSSSNAGRLLRSLVARALSDLDPIPTTHSEGSPHDAAAASSIEDAATTDDAAAAAGSRVGSSDETRLELTLDIALGVAFLGLAALAAKRMWASRRAAAAASSNNGGGAAAATAGANNARGRGASNSNVGGGQQAETAVVTAFYSLILVTSGLRSLWFLIPSKVYQPTYTPLAVYAFDPDHPYWIGAAFSELLVTAGSLCLFSIFILILVYWADILKKYFHPGSRRSLPMVTFLILVVTLFALELVNLGCFLLRLYTTEGMILYNAVLLAAVSTVCVVEITVFSHRFRTVLKTLGAINQVSTDSQVRRIVWITVTGNLFFVTRALLEIVFAATLAVYWAKHGTVDKVFRHVYWDMYIAVKYGSEITILALMLYILQSRFSSSSSSTAAAASSSGPQSSAAGRGTYQKIPEAEPRV